MIIYAILFLAFILRIINLNQSLWLDEATQVLLSKESIQNILFERGADFHPPLSYILMHFWIMLSNLEIWLRLLSVIFGVLTIWIIYKFGSEILNRKTALLATFLLAISPYHIYYSQEIRMYAESTFFAALSMYFFYRFTIRNSLTNSLIYITTSSALIYTHYDGLFLIIAQFFTILILQRSLLLSFLKKVSFVFLIYLPWIPQLLIQLRGGGNIDEYLPGWRSILSLPTLKAVPVTFFKFSLGRISFDNQSIYILVAFVTLSLFGLILYKGIKAIRLKEQKLVIYWLFIPIVCALIISFKIPINQPFRILYVIPAFYILLALGVENLMKFKRMLLVSLIALSLMGLGFYYFNPKFWREDWREAARFITENSSIDTVTIFVWPEPFSPYKFYANDKFAVGVVKSFPAKIEELENTMSKVDSKREVFLFEYLQDLADPNKFVQFELNKKGFREDKVFNFRGVGFIRHFVKQI